MRFIALCWWRTKLEPSRCSRFFNQRVKTCTCMLLKWVSLMGRILLNYTEDFSLDVLTYYLFVLSVRKTSNHFSCFRFFLICIDGFEGVFLHWLSDFGLVGILLQMPVKRWIYLRQYFILYFNVIFHHFLRLNLLSPT